MTNQRPVLEDRLTLSSVESFGVVPEVNAMLAASFKAFILTRVIEHMIGIRMSKRKRLSGEKQRSFRDGSSSTGICHSLSRIDIG